MENNIPKEIIRKIQALYLDAEVIAPDPYDDAEEPNTRRGYLTGICAEYESPEVQFIEDGGHHAFETPCYPGYEKTLLLLSPLSLITDEDAIEVYKMLRISKDFDCITENDLKDSIVAGGFMEIMMRDDYGNILEIIDFLRSRGYALPAFGYTVDQLVAAGIFTLKTLDNATT